MLRNITIILVGASFNYSIAQVKLVSISELNNSIKLDMKYATTDNFLHQKVYPCKSCLLQQEVANALISVNIEMKKMGLKMVIFDCYRPYSVQKTMYNLVKNKKYVAHPSKGSKHNSGCAVDLAFIDSNQIIDFGTDFDNFTNKANYSYRFLTKRQKTNRKILRNLMINAGFEPYDSEWWHFNFKNCTHKILDIEFKCK